MPVAPYGTEKYREWNAARIRRYREGPYGAVEANRDFWRHASPEFRDYLVEEGVYEPGGTWVPKTLAELHKEIRNGLEKFGFSTPEIEALMVGV